MNNNQLLRLPPADLLSSGYKYPLYFIRQTGLLCFSDEADNEILMEQTINAFKANPGSDYELYYGEDFKVKVLLAK